MIAWTTTSGTALGSTAIVSNATADHVCTTTTRLCASYPGYFRTGGYLTNAW